DSRPYRGGDRQREDEEDHDIAYLPEAEGGHDDHDHAYRGARRNAHRIACAVHGRTLRLASDGERRALVPAVGADAADLDAMVGGDEPVASRRLVHPAVEVAVLHFDDAMAALADEVVMVRFTAEAVALLPAVV